MFYKLSWQIIILQFYTKHFSIILLFNTNLSFSQEKDRNFSEAVVDNLAEFVEVLRQYQLPPIWQTKQEKISYYKKLLNDRVNYTKSYLTAFESKNQNKLCFKFLLKMEYIL